MNWKINDISEEEFEAYEDVRVSGETNMYDIPMVMMLAQDVLTKKQILTIMDNYLELKNKYPQVREA